MQPYGSRATWREVRHYLNGHRHRLARLAGRFYPDVPKVGSVSLLTREAWVPARPTDLHRLVLEWTDHVPPPLLTGAEPEAGTALPAGFTTYAEAMEGVERPGMFENRPCYRLLGVSWPRLRFTRGRYFEGVNVGEAVAHEFAAAHLCAAARLPFRSLAGDPTALDRRAVLPAISVLTLRRDSHSGQMTFVLHWRDPARVAHGGGLYQVMPVGVFQPSKESPRAERADFDLWKCVVREYGEEFLGRSEEYGEGFDYETWPLYRQMTDARESGALRCLMLGLGVDPLSFATDFLAVTVIDAPVFDALFGDLVTLNEEGKVIGTTGIPFDDDSVSRYIHHEPMQAAGAAVLELAWKHREALVL